MAFGSHGGSEVLRRTWLLPLFSAAVSSGSFRLFVLTVFALLVSRLLQFHPIVSQATGKRKANVKNTDAH